MEGLSLPVRRIVALGLLILLLLCAWTFVIQPLVATTTVAIDALRDARFRRARIEAIAGRPLPRQRKAFPTELLISSRDQSAAAASLEARLRQLATMHHVTLANVQNVPADPHSPLIAIGIKAQANEVDLLRFVNAIERGTPLIRFADWRIAPVDGTDLVLEGQAQAVRSIQQ